MAYDKVALLATTKIAESNVEPERAWQLAAQEIFKDKRASVEKGCPKGAFLGLCEEEYINGVPKGVYTKSKLNKEYAIKAVQLLKSRSSGPINAKVLWLEVLNGLGADPSKKHNAQMEVVLSLWENDLVR